VSMDPHRRSSTTAWARPPRTWRTFRLAPSQAPPTPRCKSDLKLRAALPRNALASSSPHIPTPMAAHVRTRAINPRRAACRQNPAPVQTSELNLIERKIWNFSRISALRSVLFWSFEKDEPTGMGHASSK
jgi:hypothetical protein